MVVVVRSHWVNRFTAFICNKFNVIDKEEVLIEKSFVPDLSKLSINISIRGLCPLVPSQEFITFSLHVYFYGITLLSDPPRL